MSNTVTVSNEKVIDLFNKMHEGTLILQPSFQRKLVWNNAHKENFIETILEGLPFPEVYFANGKIDIEKKVSETLIVDGQQRLSTIYEYIANDNNLVLKKIPKFEELNETKKTNFLDYNVVVRALGRISLDEIKAIFRRINSVQYALNAIEIENALYEGEFISAAKAILETKLLNCFEIFADSKISRMEDLGFIILIMATIEAGGYFPANKEVEAMIKRYDEEYHDKDAMIKIFTYVLRFIQELNLSADSLWLKKSCLFTLIVELMKYHSNKGGLRSSDQMTNLLTSLEANIQANKNSTDNKFGKFYHCIYQDTSSRKARIIRGELLENSMDNC